ncbi:MAG: signal recognition particle-docking protein FtsY [Chlamydiia bacterium]
MFSIFRRSLRRLQDALLKTRDFLRTGLRRIFSAPLCGETQDELERILYEADFGVASSTTIARAVVEGARRLGEPSTDAVMELLKKEIAQRMPPAGKPLQLASAGPTVVLITGANGNGKTTTIAKIAHQLREQGLKVLLAAADTFRAAASEQLQIWATRLACDFVRGPQGGDPAAVAFDACQAAVARGVDVVLIDTAGRLQNKEGLMHELAKVRRTCAKVLPQAPHETLLIVEATTGQNALDQATVFHQHTPLTGVVITKLDGTAKGGMAIALWNGCHIPIRYIGTGESEEDLELFDPDAYLKGMLDF